MMKKKLTGDSPRQLETASTQRRKGRNILIRDASVGEREIVRDLTLSSYEEYAAKIPAQWQDYRQDILDTLSDVTPAEQIVAEIDKKLAGAVLLYPAATTFYSPDEAEVTLDAPEVRLLAVAPWARGRGAGTALMKECIRRARRAGARFVRLHTTDMMEVAMRMYERMGFLRAPEYDFHVNEQLIVKGYRLDLKK